MNSRPPLTVSQMNCSMKKRHASKRVALRAATSRSQKSGVKLYVYRCRHCKDWHLTKKQTMPDRKPSDLFAAYDDFEVVPGA